MRASWLLGMRRTLRLGVETASHSPVQMASDMLLPPKQLFRALLRAHRLHLPLEMRSLGDDYVKAEFRRHQHIDNPLHIVGFCSQWKMYLDAILREAQNSNGEVHGKSLDPHLIDRFSDEQLYQLYELSLRPTTFLTQKRRRASRQHLITQAIHLKAMPALHVAAHKRLALHPALRIRSGQSTRYA